MSLKKLIWKELYSTLRNPQVLVGVIIVPVMFFIVGNIASVGIEHAAREAVTMKILFVDNDATNLTQQLVSALRQVNPNIVVQSGLGIEDIKSLLEDYKVIVVIPQGFTQQVLSLSPSKPPLINVYVSLDTLTQAMTGGRMQAADVMGKMITEALRTIVLSMHNISPELLERIQPRINTTVTIGTLSLKSYEASSLANMFFSTTFVAIMAAALVLQYGALSMAQEKEDKTFETLLSQPVPRLYIGLSKMTGVVVLALITLALFAASWYYYINKIITTSAAVSGEESPEAYLSFLSFLKNIVGLSGILALLANLFIVMIGAALLGIILGGFAADTRSAGMLIGPVWILIIMSVIAVEMIGIPASPSGQLVVAATLFLGPLVSLNSIILNTSMVTMSTIILNLLETIALAYVLSRVLNSEIMIIGTGLMRRLRTRQVSV